MAQREEFVVDTSDLPHERTAEVCRFVLELVRQDATTFETDIPLSNAAEWPAPVRRAAERLTRHATGRRGRNALYKNTGVVSVSDPTDWEALVCFAPYAFDASVWAVDGELAWLTDEGTSFGVHLSSDQRGKLMAFEGRIRVVPVEAWKKRTTMRQSQRD